MSGMSVLATHLHCATRLLDPYISALEIIESRGGLVERPDEAKSLLDVLVPLCHHFKGETYIVLGINGDDVSKLLRPRHREGWPRIRDGILSVKSRLEEGAGGRVALSGEDMSILDDISDALDSVCESLFREMRRR